MAEASEAGDNPFSFKSFMKRASTDVSLGEAKGLQEKMGKNAKASKKKKASSGDVLFPEDSDQEKGVLVSLELCTHCRGYPYVEGSMLCVLYMYIEKC